jgi:protein gp37
MQELWASDIVEECNDARVAVFVKQMAGKAPIPPDLMVRQFPQPAARPAASLMATRK